MPHSTNFLGRVCLAAVLWAVAHRIATLAVPPTTVHFVSNYSALVGGTSDLRNYLNEEFYQLTFTLLAPAKAGKKWRAIPLESSAGMPDEGRGYLDAEQAQVRCSAAWGDLEHRATALYGSTPSALMFVLKFHWNYAALACMAPCLPADRLDRPKIIACVDDLHWYDHDGASIQNNALAAADVVLSTYPNVVPSLYPSLGRRQHPSKQLAWLPHATTPQFFLARRSRSSLINAILLSGSTSKEWYPYRHAVKAQHIQRDPRFAILDHPGYTHFKKSTHVGKGFASQLNQYAACLTDGLHLNYTIAKILEIPAAGCLLLINREMTPMMARLGFYDGVHFLSYPDASAGLTRLADYVLELRNADRLNAMRRRAQHLVWRMHLVAHRVAAIRAFAM